MKTTTVYPTPMHSRKIVYQIVFRDVNVHAPLSHPFMFLTHGVKEFTKKFVYENCVVLNHTKEDLKRLRKYLKELYYMVKEHETEYSLTDMWRMDNRIVPFIKKIDDIINHTDDFTMVFDTAQDAYDYIKEFVWEIELTRHFLKESIIDIRMSKWINNTIFYVENLREVFKEDADYLLRKTHTVNTSMANITT